MYEPHSSNTQGTPQCVSVRCLIHKRCAPRWPGGHEPVTVTLSSESSRFDPGVAPGSAELPSRKTSLQLEVATGDDGRIRFTARGRYQGQDLTVDGEAGSVPGLIDELGARGTRAAVVLTLEDGVPYLDKFAVLDDAQGEGLGRAVWQLMREAEPRLFWRSRHGNPVNAFYDAEADGVVKQPRWRTYWYGLGDPEGEAMTTIRACLAHCRTRPATLVDRA